jgi:cyclopropane-fatty-acyl-phospholipid synthase
MKLLNTMLTRIVKVGTIEIEDAAGVMHTHAASPAPYVHVKLHDPALYTSLFLKPEMAAGEAYMDGTLTIEKGTLRDFVTFFALNRGVGPKTRGFKTVRRLAKKAFSFFQRNTLIRSRQNVAHHYDLSNELYGLFLDTGMNYSCAYFRSPEDTLETAQENKLRHIASKLQLKPGQKVLDIGSGWGSMAIYLAQHFDVEVLGVTLSVEQHRLAEQRATELGLSKKVRFELRDYREVDGKFDRIVSVGMFEHVGTKHYQEYFGNISKLLTNDGVALVHSIGRRSGPGMAAAWLNKYIFPGGYSPALSEAFTAIEKSGLWVTDTEIWRLHYAHTLSHWSERFARNRPRAAEMLGERFCRMWEFYLITSEISFVHFKHMVFQIQLTKSLGALPLQRDYMFETEVQLIIEEEDLLRKLH